MRIFRTILLLGLAPVLLGWSASVLRTDFGPYWQGSNMDPSYAYLGSSLLLANARAPEHVDHPGTPVQMLGAAVLRGAHMANTVQELNQQVLQSPETAIAAINKMLLTLVLLSLFATAYLAWQATGSFGLALMVQWSVLLFIEVHKSLLEVKPEPLLIVLTLVFGSLFLMRFKREMENSTAQCDHDRLFYGMCLVAGLAIATKVTFALLALVPYVFVTSLRQGLKGGAGRRAAIFFPISLYLGLGGMAPHMGVL